MRETDEGFTREMTEPCHNNAYLHAYGRNLLGFYHLQVYAAGVHVLEISGYVKCPSS